MTYEDGDEGSFRFMLQSLKTAINEEDWKEVNDNCLKILALFAKNEITDKDSMALKPFIQRVCAKSYISMSEYEKADEFVSALEEDEKELLILERSYILYQLGRYAECRDIIHDTSRNDLSDEDIRGISHILAQCHYSLHSATKAIDLYSDLVGAEEYHEDSDVVANAFAAAIDNNSVPIQHPLIKEFHDVVAEEIEKASSSDRYPFEMISNYATHILQTSTSSSQVVDALSLLVEAEESCKEIQSNGEGDCQGIRNILPIQSNIGLGYILTGDLTDATKKYLDVILTSKKSTQKNSSLKSLAIAAEHNLNVLSQMRGSSANALDLLKKMPNLSTDESSSPNQVRVAMYNRAVLYSQMKKISDMKASLSSLRNSISSTNEKKNKGAHIANSKGKFSAVPNSNAEKLLWEARVSLLENSCSGDMERLNIVENAILDAMNKDEIHDFDAQVLDFAMSEIKLHKAMISAKELPDKEKKTCLVETLEGLPTSIRERPATIASKCSLLQSLDMNDKAESTLLQYGDSGTARKNLAQFKLRLEMYDEATSIYESLLEDASNLTVEEEMEYKAGLAKALSYINVKKAVDLSRKSKIEVETELDADELEGMDIPRFSSSSTGIHSRKMICSKMDGR